MVNNTTPADHSASNGARDDEGVGGNDTSTEASANEHTATDYVAPEPVFDESESGPMASRFASDAFDDMSNRLRTSGGKANKIGEEAIAEETARRTYDSKRKRAMKEIPPEVQNIIDKITSPETQKRIKDVPLHKWSRMDTMDFFYTLVTVQVKMANPDNNPSGIQLIPVEQSIGIFVPMSDGSLSHILVTVHDPRHYMSGEERDLVNDVAISAISEVAERLITGMYSLASSLIPGSPANELAHLMGQLNEMGGDMGDLSDLQ